MNFHKAPRLLLHICCAVCAGEAVRRLRCGGYRVSGFFYNPNIYPQAEYERRLNEVKRLSAKLNFSLSAGEYETKKWHSAIRGLESEPEGGRRCGACFLMRLKKTRDIARRNAFPKIATTLTISPLKNAQLINSIGKSIDEGMFLERDFKKKGGFKRTMAFAREHNLYRQNYCGCVYSMQKPFLGVQKKRKAKNPG